MSYINLHITSLSLTKQRDRQRFIKFNLHYNGELSSVRSVIYVANMKSVPNTTFQRVTFTYNMPSLIMRMILSFKRLGTDFLSLFIFFIIIIIILFKIRIFNS